MQRYRGRQSRKISTDAIRINNIPPIIPPITAPKCDLCCNWLPIGLAMESLPEGLAVVLEGLVGLTMLELMEVLILVGLEGLGPLEDLGTLEVPEVPPNGVAEASEVKGNDC